jgi:homoserine kinase
MSTPRPWVEAFAPATVSNLGPGFDCLGLALRAPGDTVRVRKAPRPGVQILAIEGDGGELPREAEKNTAGVGAITLLQRHAQDAGVEIELRKGLPLRSGLGSSGASACASVVAVNAALELGLSPEQLVDAAREGERTACGAAPPDNVAPAILGGIVLIPGCDPLRLVSLPVPEHLWLAVYTPDHPVLTAEARSVLPERVSLDATVRQASRLALLVHALHVGDLRLLGEAVADDIVEPVRAHLIPGFLDVKAACQEAGAIACSISGAGPTTFALADDDRRASVLLGIMRELFKQAGVPGTGHIDRVGDGARVVSDPLH